MSYVSSWSGGKDGCFACYKAIRQGYGISHLINFSTIVLTGNIITHPDRITPVK